MRYSGWTHDEKGSLAAAFFHVLLLTAAAALDLLRFCLAGV